MSESNQIPVLLGKNDNQFRVTGFFYIEVDYIISCDPECECDPKGCVECTYNQYREGGGDSYTDLGKIILEKSQLTVTPIPKEITPNV